MQEGNDASKQPRESSFSLHHESAYEVKAFVIEKIEEETLRQKYGLLFIKGVIYVFISPSGIVLLPDGVSFSSILGPRPNISSSKPVSNKQHIYYFLVVYLLKFKVLILRNYKRGQGAKPLAYQTGSSPMQLRVWWPFLAQAWNCRHLTTSILDEGGDPPPPLPATKP